MSEKEEKLFSEFPAVTTEEWEAVINKDLKGADYDKKLIWKTGLSLQLTERSSHLKNCLRL